MAMLKVPNITDVLGYLTDESIPLSSTLTLRL